LKYAVVAGTVNVSAKAVDARQARQLEARRRQVRGFLISFLSTQMLQRDYKLLIDADKRESSS
jgi:hypothetical protein